MKRALLLLVLWIPCSLAAAAGVRLPAFERVTLDNGLTLLLMERDDVPMVAARVLVRGGALADPPGREGTASLLAELLSKGAGERDALAYARAIERVGGRLAFSAEREALTADAEFLARDANLMLELLADALLRPTLQQNEFSKLRTRAIQSIAAGKDGDPRGLLPVYAQSWLFRGHPYGRPLGGDESTLAALDLDDLLSCFREQVGADRTTIALVGAFDTVSMRKQVERVFGSWHKASGSLPEVSPKLRERGRRVLLVDKPGATQTYFWAGNVGVSQNDPARAAQDLVQTVFGGRFTSMLNTELRVKSGLTYGATASLARLQHAGPAGFSSFTRTDATAEALTLAFETLARLHEQGIDEETLVSAKRYVLGQFAPEYETAPQLADAISTLDLYELGREHIDHYGAAIEMASASDVAAARTAFASRDDTVLVVIGDASKIGDVIAEYGPVTVIKISDPGFAPAAPR